MAARLHTAPDEADRNTVRASELLHGNRRHRGRAVRRVPCRHQGRPGPGRPSATLKFDLRGPRRDTPRRRKIESFKENAQRTLPSSRRPTMAISLKVNGATHSVDAEPDTPLLYVLRNDLELNGAKYGCGLTQCGACTVLVNGAARRSCVTPVGSIEGNAGSTLEG